jgi:hypothetical protein
MNLPLEAKCIQRWTDLSLQIFGQDRPAVGVLAFRGKRNPPRQSIPQDTGFQRPDGRSYGFIATHKTSLLEG